MDDLLHEIAEATKNINDLSTKYPEISGEEITRLVNPLAEAFGSLPVCRLAPPEEYGPGPLEDALIKDTDTGARVTEEIRAYLAEEDEYDQRAREVYSVFIFYYCKPVPVPTDEEWNAFLSDFPPGKVKKLLPDYTPEPRALEILSYTKDEMKALRRGGPGADQARDARAIRARAFLATLPVREFIKILESATGPTTKEGQAIPEGHPHKVTRYKTTKDLITSRVFGRGESLISKDLQPIKLWGQKARDVVIYTRLEINQEEMKKAGVYISKNLSFEAQEVFGALLSHALTGNMVISIGQVGSLIFGVPADKLKESQKEFVIKGAEELFLTTQYIDTAKATEKQISLLKSQGIEIRDSGQLFPGHISIVRIRGNECSGIELYDLPLLYKLQDKLKKSQILDVPLEILQVPINLTERGLRIRNYLLKRIDAMKHNRTLPREILFSSIIEEITDTEGEEVRNARISMLVKSILDYWTKCDPKPFIAGYSALKRNGSPAQRGAPYKFKIRTVSETETRNKIDKKDIMQ